MAGIIVYPSSSDTVGVFDSSFTQQFPNARPLTADIKEPKRTMEHPLETGQIITDYAIILPAEVEIPFMVAPEFVQDVYQQIKNLYTNSTLLFVQTVANLYQNMIIANLPHEENPNFFNSIRIPIRFKQVQIVSSTLQFAPADPLNSNTQNLGVQNPASVSSVNTSSVQPGVSAPVANPIAASNSGATAGIASSVPITTPITNSSTFQNSGVATVGGTPAVAAGFGGGGF